jgi:hypothetical protein
VIFWVFSVPLNIFWAFPGFVFALKNMFLKKRKSTLPDWAEPEARPNLLRPHRPNPPARRCPSARGRPRPNRPWPPPPVHGLACAPGSRAPRPYKGGGRACCSAPRAPLLPASSAASRRRRRRWLQFSVDSVRIRRGEHPYQVLLPLLFPIRASPDP